VKLRAVGILVTLLVRANDGWDGISDSMFLDGLDAIADILGDRS
jgi:hypothetical protein